mgnify:FL=1
MEGKHIGWKGSHRRWSNNGPKDGLYYQIVSDQGDQLETGTLLGAEKLVTLLNALEQRAQFGAQCMQDQCENAYIESTVTKEMCRAAFEAGFESEACGPTIEFEDWFATFPEAKAREALLPDTQISSEEGKI